MVRKNDWVLRHPNGMYWSRKGPVPFEQAHRFRTRKEASIEAELSALGDPIEVPRERAVEEIVIPPFL